MISSRSFVGQRWVISLSAVILIAIAGISSPVTADSGAGFLATSEASLLNLTNAARADADLSTLILDPTLAKVARWRSQDMIERNYFDHNIPNPPGGVVFNELDLDRQGYCYALAGENIGWNGLSGSAATAAIQASFMASKEHHDNIMTKTWTRIGVGAYRGAEGRTMWTVLFARPCPKGTKRPGSTPLPDVEPVIETMAPLSSDVPATTEPSAATAPSADATSSPIETAEPSLASPTPATTPSPETTDEPSGPPWLLLLILGLTGAASVVVGLRRRG